MIGNYCLGDHKCGWPGLAHQLACLRAKAPSTIFITSIVYSAQVTINTIGWKIYLRKQKITLLLAPASAQASGSSCLNSAALDHLSPPGETWKFSIKKTIMDTQTAKHLKKIMRGLSWLRWRIQFDGMFICPFVPTSPSASERGLATRRLGWRRTLLFCWGRIVKLVKKVQWLAHRPLSIFWSAELITSAGLASGGLFATRSSRLRSLVEPSARKFSLYINVVCTFKKILRI